MLRFFNVIFTIRKKKKKIRQEYFETFLKKVKKRFLYNLQNGGIELIRVTWVLYW